MGIITDTVTRAIKEGIEAKGIAVKVKEKVENETVIVDGSTERVVSRIEPDVEMMPGWVISVLDAAIHIEAKIDPEDDRFEEKVLNIPFADPKAIDKAINGIDGIPLINSSSHCGVIIMEVLQESAVVSADNDTGSTVLKSDSSKKTTVSPVPAKTGDRLERKKPSEPGTGFFILKTRPPFAKVYIDGRVIGTTPMKAPFELKAGSHLLRAEKRL